SAIARALTHENTTFWVVTIKDAISETHATPPPNMTTHNNPKWRTSTNAAVVAANKMDPLEASESAENQLHNLGRMTAPNNEPAHRQPNTIPYVIESRQSSCRASTGNNAYRALPNKTNKPVRTSTARSAGA